MRIAAYPALSVPNRPVASTVSLSSTTSMVADSLWGSTPMNTLATSSAFPPSLSVDAGRALLLSLDPPMGRWCRWLDLWAGGAGRGRGLLPDLAVRVFHGGPLVAPVGLGGQVVAGGGGRRGMVEESVSMRCCQGQAVGQVQGDAVGREDASRAGTWMSLRRIVAVVALARSAAGRGWRRRG